MTRKKRQAPLDTEQTEADAPEVEATRPDKSPGFGVTNKFPSHDVLLDAEPEPEVEA